MKKHVKFSVCLLISAIFAGCSASNDNLNSYVDPSLDISLMHKIALFPIEDSEFLNSEIRIIDQKIETTIHNINSDIVVISSINADYLLDSYKLKALWLDFLDNYSSSGIADKNDLILFGDAFKIDAIIYGEIVNVHRVDGRDAFYGVEGTYGGNEGMTKVTVKYKMLSTRRGKLLWESSSDGITKTRELDVSAPPVIDAVKLAVDKIFSNLPMQE
ncbi:MAG: hypothetical protein KAI45_09030 [Melioribacteraceae bacterium]|nr:hypothetical protein [Melioribacteraceae bacterium]